MIDRVNMEKTNKEKCLEINPTVYADQDNFDYGWVIKNKHGQNITDWYLFEDDAWGEIVKHFDI